MPKGGISRSHIQVWRGTTLLRHLGPTRRAHPADVRRWVSLGGFGGGDSRPERVMSRSHATGGQEEGHTECPAIRFLFRDEVWWGQGRKD